jgi:hypothetical protein
LIALAAALYKAANKPETKQPVAKAKEEGQDKS